MDHQVFKIYNQEDFNRITRGIKVAQCMQSRSSSVSDTERVFSQLEDLVVSDTLCCSFCNATFEDKTQQRLHYKLDWHRYNLKQRLNGLKSISEDGFSVLTEEGDVSSLSGSDSESDNEDETGTSEAGGSPAGPGKASEPSSKTESANICKTEEVPVEKCKINEANSKIEPTKTLDVGELLIGQCKPAEITCKVEPTSTLEAGESSAGQYKTDETNAKTEQTSKSKKQEKKGKAVVCASDSSDTECNNEETSKEKKLEALLAVASRHSKVFFENDDGNIFSIYRCLLHNKKEIPEVDNEMIAQALDSGKKTTWTVIMIGGGHFAAAVFQDGEPIVHKTFHSYTVRAKQGASQSSRDNRSGGSHPKSAGASLRRYNEAALTQHVQDILESWSSHIENSSLILYRAVGPHNRSVLFGGKNPAIDKNDARLRPLPFPTRRATFNEVKRVYDILSTMEIYGSAQLFTDSFPISPRQPLRKKIQKTETSGEIADKGVNGDCSSTNANDSVEQQDNEKTKVVALQVSPERQQKTPRMHIDRAKARKSPCRPLPDIVARLAQSSSESELDGAKLAMNLVTTEVEISFNEHLLAFQDTVPRYMKNKKARRQKRKGKKDQADESPINEILSNAKVKLWTACKLGDNDLLSSAIQNLLLEMKKYQELEQEENKEENGEENKEENKEENGEENKEENKEGSKEEGPLRDTALMSMDNVTKLVNDSNEDGNTMLHLAAIGGHLKLIWALLEVGSDPCHKNKKLQTPYAASNDKEVRNTFRRFMGANPDKYNYHKSQIPGPLTDEIEQEELERKRQQRKAKREKEKVRRKEFEIKKQEEEAKQRFLNLCDREKRALAAEQRILKQGGTIVSRCFQCGVDMTGQVPFEYSGNRFCSMPCLKEHRLRNKYVI